MKAFFKLVGILVLLVLGLAACNTAEGIGNDLRAGGNAIRRAAD